MHRDQEVLALPPRVYPSVDFRQDGVQHGFLKVPHSNDTSAWGAVMVPITVIRRGDGPVALLTGGNHGDEYEGPIVLSRLANALKARDVTGTVIIVPFMNTPAVHAGKRTSPLDGGNLNRAFPGRADGSVTERMADYFSRCLLPMADIVLDIHSGGRTLDFLPFAAIHELNDTEQQARCDAAMQAFGAPHSLRMRDPDSHGLYDNAAEAQSKVFVTTELGAMVKRCDVIARIHDVTRTGVAPVEYRARRDGMLIGRHFPGRVSIGDTLCVLADVLPKA